MSQPPSDPPSSSTAARDWLHAGPARPLLLIWLLTLPLALTGPLRATTHVPMNLALVIAIVLVAAASRWLVPALSWPPRWRGRDWLALAAMVAASLFAVALLFNRDFAGMPEYVGADGGEHVHVLHELATTTPGAYLGFVSLHGWTYWIERIFRLDDFWGFAVAFYFMIVIVTAAPLALLTASLQSVPIRRWLLAVTAALLGWLALQYFVLLPLLSYHQIDGFYGHLFGLIPLFGFWMIDALVRPRWLRLASLLGVVALYRYTYGLNLADLTLTMAVILFLESRSLSGRPRWLLLVACPLLAVIAVAQYRMLRPLLDMWGWFVDYYIRSVTIAQLAAIGALLVGARTLRGSAVGRQGRLLRFPIAFAIINSVIVVLATQVPPTVSYYFLKYNLHAVVLLVAALVVLLGVLTEHALTQRTRSAKIASTLFVALTLTAGVLWYRGFSPYRDLFLERAWRRAPYQKLTPLADIGAMRRIESTVARQHAAFGGYITPDWMMFNFMNSALGYYNGGRRFWERGLPDESPGHCVFWEGGPNFWKTGDYPLAAVQKRLDDGPRECSTYRAHWAPERTRTLCYHCY